VVKRRELPSKTVAQKKIKQWHRSKYLKEKKRKKNTQKKIPDLHLKRKQQSMEDTQTEEQGTSGRK